MEQRLSEEQKEAIIRENIDQTARELQREKRRVYNRRYQVKHRDQIKRRTAELWREKAVALIRKQAEEGTGLFEAENITAQDFDRFLKRGGETD